jgi:NitT/TauT family transport system permease protein
MQNIFLYRKRFFSLADLVILMLIATSIYGMISIGREWQADFRPVTEIDLSIWALPKYTLFSAIRGMVAYLISLGFTLVIGYAAAKSAKAEKIILPLLDILQSLPVTAFLPGLFLGLIALFPHTNTGIELAAIISIFTSQVWNMSFSYYSSLKSVPTDFIEAARVMNLSWWERLVTLELPYSAVNLAWNSLMSVAGGWFFLSLCEAFSLGDRQYRLPGIGAYIAVATESGDNNAIVLGIVAMVLLIVGIDFFIWRPILVWVQRFRIEEVQGSSATGGAVSEPLMTIVMRESRIVRWIKAWFRHVRIRRAHQLTRKMMAPGASSPRPTPLTPLSSLGDVARALPAGAASSAAGVVGAVVQFLRSSLVVRAVNWLLMGAVLAGLGWGCVSLAQVLSVIPGHLWIQLFRDTMWTLLRVMACLLLSSLWTVPLGIWIGTSSRRIRIAQPIIQVLASFPTPMLYPVLLPLFFKIGLDFSISSMFLMMLGVQWYVLFNVLAGSLRISRELGYSLSLMQASRWDRWTSLYLPSIFPALVTGWVTAAGGAWNASIVAEYVTFKGHTYRTGGLGAMIRVATDTANFPLLAASVTVMAAVVILLNRTVWARIYHLAQTRFRMDL